MDFYKRSEFYIIIFIISSCIIVILFFLNISYLGYSTSIYLNISFYVLLIDFIFLLIYYYIRYRSIEHYKRCIEEFKKMQNMDTLIFSERFPEKDEFGDLGKHLNSFMLLLKRFDDLKKERIFLEKRKVKYFIDFINIPIIIIDKEGYIVDINSTFYKKFNITSDKLFKGIKIYTLLSENFEKDFNEFIKSDNEEYFLKNENLDLSLSIEENKKGNSFIKVDIKIVRLFSNYLIVGEENFERLEEYILFFENK